MGTFETLQEYVTGKIDLELEELKTLPDFLNNVLDLLNTYEGLEGGDTNKIQERLEILLIYLLQKYFTRKIELNLEALKTIHFLQHSLLKSLDILKQRSTRYDIDNLLEVLKFIFKNYARNFEYIFNYDILEKIFINNISSFIDIYNKLTTDNNYQYLMLKIGLEKIRKSTRYNLLYTYINLPEVINVEKLLNTIIEEINIYVIDKQDVRNIYLILDKYISNLKQRSYRVNLNESYILEKYSNTILKSIVISRLVDEGIIKIVNDLRTGGSLNQYLRYKTKDGRQIKKKIYMINGKPKVRDGKNKKKEINYVSLSTYKKKYS